jgi:uncharacterized membrane protein
VESQQTDRSRDFERFLTFVDAVVAIAITILILPLVDLATQLNGGSVADLLHDHVAEIGGFLLSFVVIARLWFAQHRAVSTVIAQDTLVMRLMICWTLTVVVLPFPTALVAQVGEQAATKIFYIGTMALSSAFLALLCVAIGRNREIRDSDEKPDPAPSAGVFVGFVLALIVSLVFPATSYFPLLVLFFTDRVIDLWRRARSRRAASADVGE